MADGKPFFTKSIFANIEIVAVLGIFSLYVLEFSGIHTFSQLLPMKGQTSAPALSFFSSSGNPIVINTATVGIMAIVALIVIVYFVFLRKKIKLRK